jgi:SRSO17 transposase
MIMSQLTLYDTNVTNILSTQINYDPLLLSMTQYVDREKMIIANSITQENNTIIESNALLGNDIRYDWINYTTTVGIDYFYNKITGGDREYNIEISDNQMIYDVELLRPGLSKFSKYIPQTIPDKKEAF